MVLVDFFIEDTYTQVTPPWSLPDTSPQAGTSHTATAWPGSSTPIAQGPASLWPGWQERACFEPGRPGWVRAQPQESYMTSLGFSAARLGMRWMQKGLGTVMGCRESAQHQGPQVAAKLHPLLAPSYQHLPHRNSRFLMASRCPMPPPGAGSSTRWVCTATSPSG